MVDATKTGAQPTLPAAIESQIRNCVRDKLQGALSGDSTKTELDREVNDGRTYTQSIEQWCVDTSQQIHDEYPDVNPLTIEKEVGASLLWQRAMHNATGEARIHVHHGSPQNLTGMLTPRVSKRCNLVSAIPQVHLDAAQSMSNVPLVIDQELFQIFWKTRREIGKSCHKAGFPRETVYSLQESVMPYRLYGMAVATNFDPFWIAVNRFCGAFRFYPDSRGTMHPSCDHVSRAMILVARSHWIHVSEYHFSSWTNEVRERFNVKGRTDRWAKRIMQDPVKAMCGQSGTGIDGVEPEVISTAKEWLRLKALPEKDRYSGFLWESDQSHSGTTHMAWRTNRAKLSDYDRRHPDYRHTRKLWYAEIQEGSVQVDFYSGACTWEEWNDEGKGFIQPVQYAGQWGPLFDIMTGTEGCRRGFKSIASYLECEFNNEHWLERFSIDFEALKKNDPDNWKVTTMQKIEANHQAMVKIAKELRKTWSNLMPWMDRRAEVMIQETKDASWKDRCISNATGDKARMSLFRAGNSSYDLSHDAEVEGDDTSKRIRSNVHTYRTEITSKILGTKRDITAEADCLVVESGFTSVVGRSTHFDDSTCMAISINIDFEEGIITISIHDAKMNMIGHVAQARRNYTIACHQHYGNVVNPDAVVMVGG